MAASQREYAEPKHKLLYFKQSAIRINTYHAQTRKIGSYNISKHVHGFEHIKNAKRLWPFPMPAID